MWENVAFFDRDNAKCRMQNAKGVMLLQLLLAFGIWQSAFGSAQALQPPVLATVEAIPAKPAKAGASVTLAVRVSPRDGIHIYAPPQKDFKPIALSVDPAEGVRIAKPRFPPAVTRTFEGEAVKVYDTPFTITVPVVLAPAARGTVTLTGAVSYQACDDLVCYRPVTVPVRWEVSVR
jgi:DsbC/DsbD-like thiol-disulfide interchange protein